MHLLLHSQCSISPGGIMSAIVKSLPIPWNDLPGSAKDRLSNDAILIAQDSAAIQDAYLLDIYHGLEPSKLSKQHMSVAYQTDIVKFRNTVYRLIRRTAREVKKGNNKTGLSDWFANVTVALHRAMKLTSEIKLATVRNDLALLLFNVKGADVKIFFVNNQNTHVVNRELLSNHLVTNGLSIEDTQQLIRNLDRVYIDTVKLDERSKQSHLNRANVLGLGPIREFLTDDQVLLIVLISYGLAANTVQQYVIGNYALITLATHLIYGVGYREFKLFALAEKTHELKQRSPTDLVIAMKAKRVPNYYIDELNRFFG